MNTTTESVTLAEENSAATVIAAASETLRRVGWALIAWSLFVFVLVAISFRTGALVSVDLGSFIGGMFLIAGSLRAASVLRWLSVFQITALLLMLISQLVAEPIDLTFVRLKLAPRLLTFASVGFWVLWLAVLSWVYMELSSVPVQAARDLAGRKRRKMWIPVALASVITIAVTATLMFIVYGSLGKRAEQEARIQLPNGYKFHTVSLFRTIVSGNKTYTAVVIAWNDTAIKPVRVNWSE